MTTTTTPVELDSVLAVAAELRRMCSRAVRVGVAFSVFQQESWAAALAHDQDICAGKSPASRTMTRSIACWPTALVRHGAGSTWNRS